jgi:hypothetical protein
VCDDFRPRYSVDLQVLRPDGEPDPDLPILSGVPLPLPVGGDEMGFYAFPEEGPSVVVCFAYGLPHKPYIQTILPHGLTLPKVPKGDQVWQHSEAVQQRVDADGNWLRQTDGKIQDKAIEREVEALDNREPYQSHTQTTADHSTETVGGVKKIEAHQATGRDLNLSWGRSTTPRWVAICRSGSRVCVKAWPVSANVCRLQRTGSVLTESIYSRSFVTRLICYRR